MHMIKIIYKTKAERNAMERALAESVDRMDEPGDILSARLNAATPLRNEGRRRYADFPQSDARKVARILNIGFSCCLTARAVFYRT